MGLRMPVNLNLDQIKKYIKTQIYKKVDIFLVILERCVLAWKLLWKLKRISVIRCRHKCKFNFMPKQVPGSAYTQLQLLHFSNCDAFRAGKLQNGQVQQLGLRTTKMGSTAVVLLSDCFLLVLNQRTLRLVEHSLYPGTFFFSGSSSSGSSAQVVQMFQHI